MFLAVENKELNQSCHLSWWRMDVNGLFLEGGVGLFCPSHESYERQNIKYKYIHRGLTCRLWPGSSKLCLVHFNLLHSQAGKISLKPGKMENTFYTEKREVKGMEMYEPFWGAVLLHEQFTTVHLQMFMALPGNLGINMGYLIVIRLFFPLFFSKSEKTTNQWKLVLAV